MQQRYACAPPTLTAPYLLRPRTVGREATSACHVACRDGMQATRPARKGRHATGRRVLRPALPASNSHASAAQKNVRRDGCGFLPGQNGAKGSRREGCGCILLRHCMMDHMARHLMGRGFTARGAWAALIPYTSPSLTDAARARRRAVCGATLPEFAALDPVVPKRYAHAARGILIGTRKVGNPGARSGRSLPPRGRVLAVVMRPGGEEQQAACLQLRHAPIVVRIRADALRSLSLEQYRRSKKGASRSGRLRR
jgi:hypothetical protein